MIRRLVEFASNPDRTRALVTISPPMSVTNYHKTKQSPNDGAYRSLLDCDRSLPKVSQADLLDHAITVLNDDQYANSVYNLTEPSILLKFLDRGGAVATYQVFFGLMMFTITILNVESAQQSLREKCSFEGQPDEVEVMKEGRPSYSARRKYMSNRKRLSESEITRELIAEKNSELEEFLMEVAIAKLCSALKIGPKFHRPLGFDGIRFAECLEYQIEMMDNPTVELIRQRKDVFSKCLKHQLSKLHSAHITLSQITADNVLYNPVTGEFLLGRISRPRFVREPAGFATHQSQELWADLYYQEALKLERLIQEMIDGPQTSNRIVLRERRDEFDQLVPKLYEISEGRLPKEPPQESRMLNQFLPYFSQMAIKIESSIKLPSWNMEFILRSIRTGLDVKPLARVAGVTTDQQSLLAQLEKTLHLQAPKDYLTLLILYKSTCSYDKYDLLLSEYLQKFKQQSRKLSNQEYGMYISRLSYHFRSYARQHFRLEGDFVDAIKELVEFELEESNSVVEEGFDILRRMLKEPYEPTTAQLQSLRANTQLLRIVVYLLLVQKKYEMVLFLIDKYQLHGTSLANVKWFARMMIYGEKNAIKMFMDELKTDKFDPRQWLEIATIILYNNYDSDKQIEGLLDNQNFDLLVSSANVSINRPGLLMILLTIVTTFMAKKSQALRSCHEALLENHRLFCTMSSLMYNRQKKLYRHESFRRRFEGRRRYDLIHFGIFLNSFNTFVFEMNFENKSQEARYNLFMAHAYANIEQFELSKLYYFQMLDIIGIEGLSHYILEESLLLMRRFSLTAPEVTNDDGKDNINCDKIRRLVERFNRLEKNPNMQQLFFIAYLWSGEDKAAYCQHYLRMALQCSSISIFNNHYPYESQILEWLAIKCIAQKLPKQCEMYLKRMERHLDDKDSSIEKMSHLARFLNISQMTNDWVRMEKYVPMLSEVLLDNEVDDTVRYYIRTFEEIIAQLFTKGRYGLVIKLAHPLKAIGKTALFYEGASLYHCHKPQKSLKCLLEFQQLSTSSTSNLSLTTMMADSSSIISHIYDRLSELQLMGDYQTKALRAYQEAADQHPEDIYTNHQTAVYSMKLSQNYTALKHLRTVLKLSRMQPASPKQFIYEIDIANCCGKLGLKRQSEFHLKLCSELQEDAYVLLQLIRNYRVDKRRKLFYKTAARLKKIADTDAFTRGLRKLLKQEQESVKLFVLYNRLPKQYMEHPEVVKIITELKSQGNEIEQGSSASERCAQLILCKKMRIESLTVKPPLIEVAGNAQSMRLKLLR